jgi:hypothetical protein
MIDLLDANAINGFGFFLMAVALTSAILILVRTSRSIFDPWFPIAVNHAILVLIVSYLYVAGVISIAQFSYWIAGTAALFGPLIFRDRRRPPINAVFTFSSKRHVVTFLLAGYFLCTYQIFFDLIYIVARGIPVFKEYGANPQIYTGGFGIVKYIHDATRLVLPPIATYVLFLSNDRKFYRVLMFSSFYPAIFFEWSKVGFITVAANYWICYLYFFGRTERLRNTTRLGLIFAVAFVFFMFSRVASSGYGGDTLNAILLRLVDTGDSVHMYYVLGADNNIPSSYNFFEYAFSLVAGFFFVNIDTIGHVIQASANISTEAGFGPSPPAQIVGSIFFGYFGIVYCLSVGLLLRLIRRKISIQKVELRILFLMLYIVSPALTGDLSLLFYYFFTLLFVTPPILCALIISKATRWSGRRAVRA